MEDKEILGLCEAYLDVYQLDEKEEAFPYGKVGDKLRSLYKRKQEAKTSEERNKIAKRQEKINKEYNAPMEEVNIYDVIFSHLLDEGYANTEESAIAIMANMSEGWMESIVEEVLDEEKKEFPSDRVRKQSAKHERDSIANGNPKSKFKARKMKAIASTVETGSDPRNTMHGQDLRKIR
jgi:hypothetical protein